MAVAPQSGRKRKLADRLPKKAQRPRKFHRAASYHSSSDEDDIGPIENDVAVPNVDAALEDASDASSDDGVELPNLDTTTTGVIDQREDIAAQANGKAQHELAERTAEDTTAAGEAEIEDTDEDADEGEEEDEDGMSDAASSISEGESASTATRERRLQNRNDPSVFASSISRILDSKLTTNQRTDPILSRSKAASTNAQEQAEAKLTAKAKRKMKEDKRSTLEKGRQRDLLGLDREDVETGKVVEKEKDLRRTAQRGVVKLFNAVRVAQMKGMDMEQGEKARGTVGMDKRKEKVEDMGKKAFLDLLVEGGG